ncbi:MAG: FecR domain-containing protein [Proteobacteria bacterium]|nr:FecR domain-containing protein [Pseudomonadota bacterium]
MNKKKVFYSFFVVLLALQILFPATLLADVVGKFNEVRGDVSMLRATVTTTPKVEGPVETKDVVATGDKARAKLLLTDDTLLSVGQKSNLEVTEYLLDKNRRSSIISLKAGAMHTKVEKFLDPDSKFEVHTPTAVAGARGTEWLTVVSENPGTTFYALQNSIAVFNPALPTQVVTVVAGQFTTVMAGLAPTIPAAFIPAAIGGIMGEVGAAMPTGAVGAGAAGASAGTAAGAGIGAGTIAIGAAVVAAGVAVAASSSGSSGTTPTHSTSSHSHPY